MPGPQHRQCCRYQAPTVRLRDFEHITSKLTELGALATGIERTDHAAPDQIASDGQIIAGRVDRGIDQCLHILAEPKDADVHPGLRQCLTQRDPLEWMLAIVN